MSLFIWKYIADQEYIYGVGTQKGKIFIPIAINEKRAIKEPSFKKRKGGPCSMDFLLLLLKASSRVLC